MDGYIPFRFLPSFKLDTLASLLLKHGELQYQRLFGLRVIECQILGAVAQYGPVTLRQTCVEVDIDKGQGSRLVARLAQAGWLERRADPLDQRSFFLLLTPAGRTLHQRINLAAVERNRQWLAGLTGKDQTQFVGCLDLLIRQSQALLQEETERSGAPAAAVPTHALAEPATDEARPLLIAPEHLRSLHRQLGELLALTPQDARTDLPRSPGKTRRRRGIPAA